MFRQGIALLHLGIPYESIFGTPRPWNKVWRNAAMLVLKELKGVNDDE